MCQSIVGKIVKINSDEAEVKINDRIKTVNIEFLEVEEGDYILLAGNIAIEKVEKEDVGLIIGDSNENRE